MNPLAQELNALLAGTAAERLLSGLGRRLYFPKGIIAQSGEAKKSAHFANATIGMAFAGGKPLILSAIAEGMPTLSPAEAVAYAPTAGVEAARQAWKKEMGAKNPSLDLSKISLPAAVPGLTAGIAYIADLFVDEDTPIIVPDPTWDNYPLIFADRRGAPLKEVPFFSDGTGLDLPAIEAAVKETAATGAVRIILNFPQNPTGYTPSPDEAAALTAMLVRAAEGGADVLVLCDDAYFGFGYEDGLEPESLFCRLAGAHERILAVKIDGPTKEHYVWGQRLGFLTFAGKGLSDAALDAIVKKLMGAIRSSVSCASTSAQNLMLRALEDPRTAQEKLGYKELLLGRYRAVKGFLASHPASPRLRPLPFNSGYFMSFRCVGISADALRKALLSKHGIGTVALADRYLRVAFSSVDEGKIPELYGKIWETAAEL